MHSTFLEMWIHNIFLLSVYVVQHNKLESLGKKLFVPLSTLTSGDPEILHSPAVGEKLIFPTLHRKIVPMKQFLIVLPVEIDCINYLINIVFYFDLKKCQVRFAIHILQLIGDKLFMDTLSKHGYSVKLYSAIIKDNWQGLSWNQSIKELLLKNSLDYDKCLNARKASRRILCIANQHAFLENRENDSDEGKRFHVDLNGRVWPFIGYIACLSNDWWLLEHSIGRGGLNRLNTPWKGLI